LRKPASGGSATCPRNPFRVKPEEVLEMIRLIELCRKQNPRFALP